MASNDKLLIIGSAVADVIITLDHLPAKSEDVHVITQEMRMGGCAYNTYDMVRHFGVDAIPFFPIGTGAYGDFVRSCFAKRGIETPLPTPSWDNGCCYCFIEADGERTFISYHGAEYRFENEWFSLIDPGTVDSVYICGLEIEEPTGVHIVSFLESLSAYRQKNDLPFRLFFAPGPRLTRIDPSLIRRIFSLHPVLHLNDEEACAFAGLNEAGGPDAGRSETKGSETGEVKKTASTDQEEIDGEPAEHAARILYEKTLAPVLVTLGSRGCLVFDGKDLTRVDPVPTKQIDTIGAGDAHIGAVMACLKKGKSLLASVETANLISSKVVNVHGALLSDDEFNRIITKETPL